LLDEKGKKRVMLDGGGLSGLTLYDEQERIRGYFTATDLLGLGASLILQDEQGHVGTRLKYGEVSAVEVETERATAKKFILTDANEKVRARLYVTEKHTENMTLPGMPAPVPANFNSSPMLTLFDEKGQARVMLDNSNISFVNSEGQGHGILGNGFLSLMGDGVSSAWLAPGSIGVSDDQGFLTSVGVQALVTPRTGETQKTSAASIVLFDKNKNVIWKAP
jgi:hypothetical protein